MTLAPCPCGAVPGKLSLEWAADSCKWGLVSGTCCHEWFIEFRTHYHPLDSDACYAEAVKAWNAAPRGGIGMSISNNKPIIRPDDHRDLLIQAFRYSLGRQTYATATMQDALRYAWPLLSAGDRQLIHREIQQHKDDFGAIGSPWIDEPGWLALLALPVEDEV